MSLYAVRYYPGQNIHLPVFENTTRITHVQSTIKRQDTPIYISWSFPPSGFIKINTDGSFMPNSGVAGFGGIARDDKGRWLGGFYGKLSMKATSSLTPELLGIFGGLNLAKNHNLKKVIIETDSSESLMLLSVRDINESHPDHVLIKECRYLMSELQISLIHTLRQGNSCADQMAKLGRKQNQDMVLLYHPPPSMHQLILADMAHVGYARYPKHIVT